MSSLWTPGGEYPVGTTPSGEGGAAAGRTGSDPTGTPPQPQLSPEQESELADAAEQMARFQEQLAQAPAEMVVANHVMGLYELAAIHLNRDSPNLESARLAIDALGGALDACRGRLGEAEATLVDARAQLQMAFVQVVQWVQSQNRDGGSEGDDRG